MFYCSRGRMNHLAQPVLGIVNKLRRGEPDVCLSEEIISNRFEDGESDVRIVDYEMIKGRHVVFFASTHEERLVLQALDFCWMFKRQYGAKSLTVVMPFMAYRRQDRPEKKHE